MLNLTYNSHPQESAVVGNILLSLGLLCPRSGSALGVGVGVELDREGSRLPPMSLQAGGTLRSQLLLLLLLLGLFPCLIFSPENVPNQLRWGIGRKFLWRGKCQQFLMLGSSLNNRRRRRGDILLPVVSYGDLGGVLILLQSVLLALVSPVRVVLRADRSLS